jgi:hypothetical protein
MANEVPHQRLIEYVAGNVTPPDFAANAIVLINQGPPRIDKTYLQTTAEDDIKLSFDFAGSPEVVRINECDESGASGLPTSISCGRNAGIFLRNQGNSAVNRCMCLYDGASAVRGAVVYHDNFQLTMRLAPDASQGVSDSSFCIVGRDHNAYQM